MGPVIVALLVVRVGVFGLFHPRLLELKPSPGTVVVLEAGGEKMFLESGEAAELVLQGTSVACLGRGQRIAGASLRAKARDGRAARMILTVPGKIERRFAGLLTVTATHGELAAVLETDLESATASVVAAESPAGAPLEALKAQAVAARSHYAAARARHTGFDFCDTTHCQYMRESLEDGQPAVAATLDTRGVVLSYRDAPLAALYSASCGGRTLSLADIGIISDGYPYFGVDCTACRRSSREWETRLPLRLDQLSEIGRLRIGRKLGWSAVPGNHYEVIANQADTVIRGQGAGHGVGLCQHGAAAMATAGAGFREILRHYYLNTVLSVLDP